jgi:hypothetical protein
MPDGDRFERTLYGRGWRKAYRQACINESFNHLGDTLIRGVASALRGPLACQSMAKIRDAIYHALKEKAREGQLNFGDQAVADPFRMLTDLLSDIADEEANSVAVQLAARAAQTVYLDLQRDCEGVTSGQIQDRLGKELGEWVIRHQFLAKVRDGIVTKNKRTAEEQMAWENALFANLEKRLSKTVEGAFSQDGKVSVRAARRTTPQRKMTMEELREGIAVLEV